MFFKVTISNESSLFVPLQGIALQNSWLGGAFLKDYKICKNNEGNEKKIMVGDLNCAMDKTDRDDENKTQRIYRCCLFMPCLNSSWIMGLRIY